MSILQDIRTAGTASDFFIVKCVIMLNLCLHTVKSLVVTTSHKRLSLLSDLFFKLRKVSKSKLMTMFGTSCKQAPLIKDHHHF